MEIPAGLVCENGEFFVYGSEIHSLHGSKRHAFLETPEEMIRALDNSITQQDYLCLKKLGITDQVNGSNATMQGLTLFRILFVDRTTYEENMFNAALEVGNAHMKANFVGL
jgi:hypothetical protein